MKKIYSIGVFIVVSCPVLAQSKYCMPLENANGYRTIKLQSYSFENNNILNQKDLGQFGILHYYQVVSPKLLSIGQNSLKDISVVYYQNQLAYILLQSDIGNGKNIYELFKKAYGEPQIIKGNTVVWDAISISLVMKVNLSDNETTFVYIDHSINNRIDLTKQAKDSSAIFQLIQ